jgi:hypothetical protein
MVKTFVPAAPMPAFKMEKQKTKSSENPGRSMERSRQLLLRI